MKVMLLAAGKGTRMLPLTEHTPKPLLKVGGISLIEHQLRKLASAGFHEVVINHAWLGAQLEQALGDGSTLGVQIQWSREAEPLETAGGIIQALPLLGEQPFALVNADLWTDFPFERLQQVLAPGMRAHLVLVPNPQHHPLGDFVLGASGELLQRSTETQPAHTYSGIAVFHPKLFAGVTERKFPLLPLLEQAIKQKAATAEMYGGTWIDIGTPQRLQELDTRLLADRHIGESHE